MKPILEKVTVPAGASWTLFHRRLPSFPFEWHYHPEYELTFTLNSLGQRYIGDHIASYGDGDLALVGPNLPHTWQSARPIDPARPHTAIVMWFISPGRGMTGGIVTSWRGPKANGASCCFAESCSKRA